MKNKRLIALISVFVLIVLVIVLNSTVFTLQAVSFNWLTNKYKFKDQTENQILSGITLPIGNSVFLINKNNIISEIEKQQPFLYVVSVETVFPNKLVVHVAERSSLYALKLNSNNYAILDQSLKVLEFKEASQLPPKDEGRPVIVNVLNSTDINDTSFKIGETLSQTNYANLLNALTISFLEGSATLQSDDIPLLILGTVNSITLDELSKDINIQTSYGTKIQIKNSQENLTKKLMLAFVRYFDMTEQQKALGSNLTIYVTSDEQSGRIIANLIES